MARRRRVLLVAYQFPPVGGAGVQRVAKFAKYLPEAGWDVTVLTVQNPSTPVADSSLAAEIPADTQIVAARSWEPGYSVKSSLAQADSAAPQEGGWWRRAAGAVGRRLRQAARRLAVAALQPDPQILWAPNAIRAGMARLRTQPHDAILVSGPPFSSFLVAAALSRRSGLPLAVDYRDEWTISNRYWENKRDDFWSRGWATWMQRRVLRRAGRLIATTRRSADALRGELDRIGRSIPVDCLPNGFDAEDFPPNSDDASLAARPAVADGANHAAAAERPYRVAHVGTLWRLTSARPLVAAVEQFARTRPDLARRLELQLLGRCTAAEVETLEPLRQGPCRLDRRDYVPHDEAVAAMQSADELCLLLADVPEASRVMPAKAFEYLASGRRILALAPEGEVRQLLEGQPGVAVFDPHDTDGICAHWTRRLQAVEPTPARFSRELTPYDRRAQAGRLSELLDELIGARRRAGAERSEGPALRSAPVGST